MLKRILLAVAPETTTAILSARARAHSQRLVKEWGLSEINEKLIREVGDRVVDGPFRGLKLTPKTYAEHIGPYLFGTYEMELNPWWEEVFRHRFDQVINVGAKFGFYAVGLGQKLPRAQIIAFDPDWWARDAIREMGAGNEVPGITIRGFCSPRWLKKHLRNDALIISDCEGYEAVLFSADVPAFATATMIVELHEDASPGVSAEMVSRFSQSHFARRVRSRSETPPLALRPAGLTEDESRRTSSEIRPQQEWLFLQPRRAQMSQRS